MTLTEEEKRELEELVAKIPKWQNYLEQFRQKHPEMPAKEVMKKAAFTRRMFVGKLTAKYVDKLFRRVLKEHGIE